MIGRDELFSVSREFFHLVKLLRIHQRSNGGLGGNEHSAKRAGLYDTALLSLLDDQSQITQSNQFSIAITANVQYRRLFLHSSIVLSSTNRLSCTSRPRDCYQQGIAAGR